MNQAKSDSGYYPTLDGWRAVAILAVIVCHLRSNLVAMGHGNSLIMTLAGAGGYGVSLFFAISGFLICSRLLREYDTKGSISLTNFYLRRFFRILPLYYSYLVILALLGTYASVPVSRLEITSSLVFLRNYVVPPYGMYTEHLWSLAVEEHFYLLWPFFLVFVTPRRALWLTPLIGLAIHCWRSADSRWHLFPVSISEASIYFRTDTRIDGILWGCCAALLRAKYPCYGFPGWAAYVTIIVLVAAVALEAPLLPLLINLLFPLLIVSTVTCPASLLSRGLELPAIRWFGRLSYSLYIWQSIFLLTHLTPDPEWLTQLKWWPLNLGMILLCSVTSHYVIERPMIRLGRRLTPRKPLPSETSTT